MMRQYGLVHNDIKPENILVVDDPTMKRKVLKLIDFGGANNKLIIEGGYTEEFYLNHTAKSDDSSKILKFNDMDEKYENEMFSVARTMQNILMPKLFKDNKTKLKSMSFEENEKF